MNINLEEYLKNMRIDRNRKYENEKDEKDKNFYWGQVCIIDEILWDIKNKMIKV